jgi:hypothetical protein
LLDEQNGIILEIAEYHQQINLILSKDRTLCSLDKRVQPFTDYFLFVPTMV